MQSPDLSVLHIATAISWRGGEQQVVYLAEELKRKNIRQFILCSEGSAMEDYCIRNNLPFITARKRSSFDLSFAKKVSDVCKVKKISLVHAHDSHAHTFAFLSCAVFANKAKVIISRRVDFPVGETFISRVKYNHSCIARIICVSDKIREIIHPAIKNPKVLTTIHSGIDESRFENAVATGILHREFNIPVNARIVGNISALAPHKDYKTFIDTAAEVLKSENDLYFFIIGDGPEKSNIENFRQASGVSDRIIMTGFRTDIPSILPELDVIVMLVTSETEGLGTTILDAFACKVPVVATEAGGIPELVINERTGLLAPVRDVAGLAVAVKRILNEAGLKEKLNRGSAEHLKNFSRQFTAEQTLSLYKEVLGESNEKI
jgi:L-malate glycosyltransferase